MPNELSREELWTTIISAFRIAVKQWRRGQYGLGVSDSQNAEWEKQIQRILQAKKQLKSILSQKESEVRHPTSDKKEVGEEEFNKKKRRAVLAWAERWKSNLPFLAYKNLMKIMKAKNTNL